MRRIPWVLLLSTTLLAIVIYAGLPARPQAIRAMRVSQQRSTAKPAWSSSGARLSRSNAGSVFIYDLSKYIYNDPRDTKPVLIADIETPGVQRMSWSSDDKEILIHVNTYDIFSPSMLVEIAGEELLTIEPTGSLDISHMFWLKPGVLGAISPASGIDPTARVVTMRRLGASARANDGLLDSKVLRLKTRRLSKIEPDAGDDTDFGPLLRGRFLLGIRGDGSSRSELIALELATGRVELLAKGIREITATDKGRAVVSYESDYYLATVGPTEFELGQKLSIVDRWGRPLKATNMSISPTGDFIAFDSADPTDPGMYVAPLP